MLWRRFRYRSGGARKASGEAQFLSWIYLVMDKRAALAAYCKLMEVIRARTGAILFLANEPTGLPPFCVSELQQLQVRMICETLAKACLVLHGDIAGAKSTRLTTAYQADLIMNALEKLHPRFYPKPVRPGPQKDGIDGMLDIADGFLTKKELLKSYHGASDCLHAGEIQEIVAGKYKRTNPEWIRDWTKKLFVLLNNHTIYLKDGAGAWDGKEPIKYDNGEPAPKYQVIVAMRSGPDEKPEARIFEVISRLEDLPKGSAQQS